jgi:DNA-binding winged helix-turn-helix (wHTH) protein/Tfp pilus assembly protein PilF
MNYTRPVYEFGHFRMDAAERVLSCSDKPVQLTLKAFAVLCVLVEKAGHVVEKSEFMRQVWPDAFVEDSNLTQSIALLRRALCENPDRREYIETIHRRGYRFIAVVKVMEVLDSGKAFASDKSGVRDGIQGLQKSRATRSNVAKPIARIDSQDACASRTFIKCYTESEEAQHLYVRGRWYWNKYTVEGLTKGIDHFRDAIKIDPKYALAYAGLADCYYRLSNIHLHPKEAMPKAEMAAVNALLIDERLAEAHALLGLIRMFYDRDWPAAETEFRRSIELAPDCALVHKRYGWALGMLGNFDKAITEMKQALSLAPLSPDLHVGLGIVLHLARRDVAGIAHAQQALDIDPDFHLARTLLGMAYAQEGRLIEAVKELEEAASLANLPWTSGYLGYAYAVSGETGPALDLLIELAQRSKQTYVSPFCLALIHAGLGDKEQALRALERTWEDRNEMFGLVKASPEFSSVRSEKRFEALFHQNPTSVNPF